MKKLTTILTAIVLLFAASAFALNGEQVTAKVKFAFEKNFTKAKNVNWKKTGDFFCLVYYERLYCRCCLQ